VGVTELTSWRGRAWPGAEGAGGWGNRWGEITGTNLLKGKSLARSWGSWWVKGARERAQVRRTTRPRLTSRLSDRSNRRNFLLLPPALRNPSSIRDGENRWKNETTSTLRFEFAFVYPCLLLEQDQAAINDTQQNQEGWIILLALQTLRRNLRNFF
jgi:hypothetical protein